MRICLLANPYVFSRTGGLQRHIFQLRESINRNGAEATVFFPESDRFDGYDIAQVFDAADGNFRLVESAKYYGLPVVISTVLPPTWTYWQGWRARLADWLTTHITARQISTSYAQTLWALQRADRLVTMGGLEKRMLTAVYRIPPATISVIPPGVDRQFFDADPVLFRQRFGLAPGYLLCVGQINPHKNQLALAQALQKDNVQIALLGPCLETNRPYLAQLLNYKNVHYYGVLDYQDPLLASAYAGAGLFALPSLSETGPLVAYEALAAGARVVLTRHNSLDLADLHDFVIEVNPTDNHAIRQGVLDLLRRPHDAVRLAGLMQERTWDKVAQAYLAVYKDVIAHQAH